MGEMFQEGERFGPLRLWAALKSPSLNRVNKVLTLKLETLICKKLLKFFLLDNYFSDLLTEIQI